MKSPSKRIDQKRIGLAVIIVVMIIAGFFLFQSDMVSGEATYSSSVTLHSSASALNATATATLPVVPTLPPVAHIQTPNPVRALYMTSWVAGTPSMRDHIINLLDTTEANAVVIDIKDYSGKIAFTVTDPKLIELGAVEQRIPDIHGLIKTLHDKNIYVIGRISTFQDSHLVTTHPEWAVGKVGGGVWGDRKGIHWLDVKAESVWDYTIALAKESHNLGFDEINFDYIRFPSDGNLDAIEYRHYDKTKETKAEALESFFKYLHKNLNGVMPISADLFGMTTSVTDDMGIGQVLEQALPYFDAIAPMIYPSHYPANWNGYANPAANPYEVIHQAMTDGIRRAEAPTKVTTTVPATATASSTTTTVTGPALASRAKFRPWLQDFDLGADYTPEMIQAQKKALYDLGINSWMLWDPSNKYTPGGLDLK